MNDPRERILGFIVGSLIFLFLCVSVFANVFNEHPLAMFVVWTGIMCVSVFTNLFLWWWKG